MYFVLRNVSVLLIYLFFVWQNQFILDTLVHLFVRTVGRL